MFLQAISIYLFLGMMFTAFLATGLLTSNRSPHSKQLATFCVLLVIYTFGYLMELHSTTLQDALFWIKIEYLGVPFLSATWLTIAMMYAGKYKKSAKIQHIALYLIPIITLVLNLTNQYHHLYYSSYQLTRHMGLNVLLLEKGFWYYVQTFYFIVTILFSTWLVYTAYLKKRNNEQSRILKAITISSFVPLLSIALEIINPLDFSLDYTVLVFPIMIVVLSHFIRKDDFLEIQSLARAELFKTSLQGMLILDRNHHVIDFNQEASRFFISLDLPLTYDHIDMICGNNISLHKLMLNLSQDQDLYYDDQHDVYWKIHAKSIKNRQGKCIGSLREFTDVTESVKIQKHLEFISKIDDLSSLLNRREFTNLGNQWIASNEKNEKEIVLILLDIDHFKNINDTFGHIAGDEVINKIGHLLKSKFRDTDIIARFGGEEFVIMMKVSAIEEAVKRTNRLLRSLESLPFIPSSPLYKLTASAGISILQEGDLLKTLIHRADQALYASKNNGRNQVQIY